MTKLKYYVSNFVLTNVNETQYTVPQDSCYFLIDESVSSAHHAELKLPEGEYKTLTFMIGVDSLRNTKDISERTGVLDPAGDAADMYWGWNSGYIFFKIEGTSPLIADMGNAFMYHVGGFGGYNTATPNNLKTVTLDLTTGGTPKVKLNKETNIHLMADVLKVVNGSTNISFATTAMIHSREVVARLLIIIRICSDTIIPKISDDGSQISIGDNDLFRRYLCLRKRRCCTIYGVSKTG